MNDSSNMIPVTLKWNKKTFPLTIELGETAATFKERIQALTGVPVTRQKLLAKKGGWKGTLKDEVVLDASNLVVSKDSSLTVTLIGSAETLSEPTHKTTFLEDLSPAEMRAAEEAKAQAAMGTAEGMIPVLQLPPHLRDDHKQEFYQYNRLVTGLPQRQIEQELKHSQKHCQNHGEEGDSSLLQGKVALQLELELRRGYVNDLAVLDDGTCVSVLDDGHVQLWKHAAQQHDAVHPGAEGGVDSVVALTQQKNNNNTIAFATAGRGSLQLWTAEADPILTLPGAMPGTSPASLQCVFGGSSSHYHGSAVLNSFDTTTTCLAARFQITRTTNPSQFRLPPQNEAERQRRAQAEAQERAIQQALAKAARSLQVWFSLDEQTETTARGPSLQSQILEPPAGVLEGSAPITCLATLTFPPKDGHNDKERFKLLVAGDAAGGLRFWRVQREEKSLHFHHQGLYQLVSTTNDASCAVVCMEALRDGRLVVSTGGGKMDATLQLWSRDQIDAGKREEAAMGDTAILQAQATKTLTNVGYVFALAVLPDAKHDSNYYSVAAGRYNTVKVII